VRSNVSFTLSAEDAQTPTGIVTRFSLTPPGGVQTYGGPVTVSAEGTTALSYWSTDAAGNAETPHTATVRIDKTPPTTTSDAESSYRGTATVHLSATDAYSGVALTRFSLDGAPASAGSVVTAGVGSHVLQFASTDVAGNVEASETVSFIVGPADTTPPQTSLSPALPTTWVRSNVSFTLAATDDGGPSGIVTLYSLTPPGGTKSYTAPVTVTAQGVTSLSYWSVDAAGNAETPHTGTIRIDSSAPVTTSNAKSRYARTATIRLTATDRYSGVAATRFSLDGAAYKTGTSVTAGTGSHTLRYYSTDVAGNTESVRTVRFTVRR
jgi:hypothetical protein